ncbi:MAG: hypothetical protein KF767_00830 [Bdellovibrionaceae bacterium]|nr:hypothetical protein [Pseudobdellovibrionaceae bacterium]
MKPSLRSILRLLAVAGGLATLSLGFQNCGGKGFEVANLEEALQQQNIIPEPVLGTLRFQRLAADPAACDGNEIESLIEETAAGVIQLVRKDCADLEKPLKLDIYKTSKLAHNSSFLFYEGQLFRLDPTSVTLEEGQTLDPELEYYTDGICRTEVNDNGTRRVTDVRVYQDANGKAKSKVLIGEYRGGNVLGTYKSVEMEIERNYDQDGVTLDAAVGLPEGESFSLTLETSATSIKGTIGFTKGIFGESAPAVLIDGQTTLTPNMSCYQ